MSIEVNKLDFDENDLLSEARSILELRVMDSKLSDNTLICECLCISVGDIRNCLKGNVVDFKILSDELKLGSGCSSCKKSFNDWKDKI